MKHLVLVARVVNYDSLPLDLQRLVPVESMARSKLAAGPPFLNLLTQPLHLHLLQRDRKYSVYTTYQRLFPNLPRPSLQSNQFLLQTPNLYLPNKSLTRHVSSLPILPSPIGQSTIRTQTNLQTECQITTMSLTPISNMTSLIPMSLTTSRIQTRLMKVLHE